MSGWDAAAAGVDPERVAELLVAPAGPGPGRRGSGYRVTASAVLTAAHVVRDAARVQVRFNADRPTEWLTDGQVVWSEEAVDAAVVAITPRPGEEGRLAPAGFGRVAERDAVLACSAMGFPRFKLREDPGRPLDDGSPSQYRDTAHAVGSIAVLSNRREGTLEVAVPPPERDPDPRASPWGGMSGAALWSTGRIIGVVAEHHRSDGLGRLAATRVDRWYERLPPDAWARLGTVTGLPASAAELREVVAPSAAELLEAGYLAQVRDIAPRRLLGRDEELGELVRFCAGDEPYRWLRADAWAGKSALAAWFVLHPPAGVSVVSFFVTRRLAGHADSDAFTEAMVEQLAAVAGEAPPDATAAARDRERSRLLDEAARRVGERGMQLLLVVDGLDEDEGARPASGKPSIASLLPRRPAGNVRVLVTSRPHPGIPSDVPAGHPLRACVPRALTRSPYAHDIELAAKHELREQLHGGELEEAVLGFITAAGGGLTLTELAELTATPAWKLDGKLGTVFGRSLMTRAQDSRPEARADAVYLFAHETLRVTAEQELAHDLDPYRRRIHEWADGYRARGWPDGTPRYLLRPYGRLLAAGGDLGRLVEVATDPARHDRLLAATLGDGAAIAEIATAQRLLLELPAPDLGELGHLAVHRDRLANRNGTLPVGLPALLVRLGQRQRGEALARGMPSPGQPRALATVAEALAEDGRWHRAEEVARSIADADVRARALAAVGRALARVDRERAVGLLEDAGRVAVAVPREYVRPFAMAAVAEAFAAAGLRERAEETVAAIAPQYAAAGARALRGVAEGLAGAGDWARAEATARAIPSRWERAAALATVGRALAGRDRDRAMALLGDVEESARRMVVSGGDTAALGTILAAVGEVDPDRSARLAADVEQVAAGIPHPAGRAAALAAVAEALAQVRRWDQADRVAGTIASPQVRAEATAALALALAAAGRWDRAERAARGLGDPRARAETLVGLATALVAHDPDRALAMAAEAEATARAIPHPGRFWALQALASAQAAAGQLDLAERTARTLEPPDRALGRLAKAQAAAGQWDRAEETIGAIADPDARGTALAALAGALTAAGRWQRAERAARRLGDDQAAHARALAALAAALAPVDRDRAMALAAEAEEAARHSGDTGADPADRLGALGAAAAALLALDRDRALALAAEAEREHRAELPDGDPFARVRGLGELAAALAAADPDRAGAAAAEAERTAGLAGEQDRDDALTAVAEAQAAVGRWDHAELAARGIADPDTRVRALATLAGAVLAVDPGRGLALAAAAEEAARGIAEPYDQATALVVLAERLAAALAPGVAGGDDLRGRLRRLLAEVLAGERWLGALEPLGRLDPAALSAVGDALGAGLVIPG
jgi:hypothetical protein